MLQKQARAVPFDIGFKPEAGVSGPVLLQTDDDAFLTFNAVHMTSDGKRGTAGTGVIELEGCYITKFGYPNDEGLGGHPLYKHGLGFYDVFEVLDSSWIQQMTEQRHFIFTFHDSTFECVANSLRATLSTEPYEQIFRQITQRVFHHAA